MHARRPRPSADRFARLPRPPLRPRRASLVHMASAIGGAGDYYAAPRRGAGRPGFPDGPGRLGARPSLPARRIGGAAAPLGRRPQPRRGCRAGDGEPAAGGPTGRFPRALHPGPRSGRRRAVLRTTRGAGVSRRSLLLLRRRERQGAAAGGAAPEGGAAGHLERSAVAPCVGGPRPRTNAGMRRAARPRNALFPAGPSP